MGRIRVNQSDIKPDVPCLVNPWVMTGWTPSPNAWTFNQSFAPVYQIYCSGYVAANYSPGMKVRLTHGGATKYFIVIDVADVGGWNLTIMYLYGGTDYTLSAGEITDAMYSTDYCPVGWPADPRKWTARMMDTSARNKASGVVADTWYHTADSGTFGELLVPLGLWRLSYQANFNVHRPSSTDTLSQITLASAANTESDIDLTACIRTTDIRITSPVFRQKSVSVVSEQGQTWYINLKTNVGGSSALGVAGQRGATVIEAESAYI